MRQASRTLLHTKVFEDISDQRVSDLLGGWEVSSRYAEKLMAVLQPYAYQLCVL